MLPRSYAYGDVSKLCSKSSMTYNSLLFFFNWDWNTVLKIHISTHTFPWNKCNIIYTIYWLLFHLRALYVCIINSCLPSPPPIWFRLRFLTSVNLGLISFLYSRSNKLYHQINYWNNLQRVTEKDKSEIFQDFAHQVEEYATPSEYATYKDIHSSLSSNELYCRKHV